MHVLRQAPAYVESSAGRLQSASESSPVESHVGVVLLRASVGRELSQGEARAVLPHLLLQGRCLLNDILARASALSAALALTLAAFFGFCSNMSGLWWLQAGFMTWHCR